MNFLKVTEKKAISDIPPVRGDVVNTWLMCHICAEDKNGNHIELSESDITKEFFALAKTGFQQDKFVHETRHSSDC